MTRFFSLLVFIAAITQASGSQAATLRYDFDLRAALYGSYGSVGSFDYDSDADVFANVDIEFLASGVVRPDVYLVRDPYVTADGFNLDLNYGFTNVYLPVALAQMKAGDVYSISGYYPNFPTQGTMSVSSVPVPGTMMLFGAGLLGLGLRRRRSSRATHAAA